MLKNLLHLGLMCCLANPQERPTTERVVQVLNQVDEDYVLNNLSIPLFLLDTNPEETYYPMQSSQSTISTELDNTLPVQLSLDY